MVAYFAVAAPLGSNVDAAFAELRSGQMDSTGDDTSHSPVALLKFPTIPSSYRFLVRAINEEGSVSPMPAVVSFLVLRPVWQRWWFITLGVLILATPILMVARYRHQRIKSEQEAEKALRGSREERLRELEQVRRRIASDLHDDIGSSLTRISLLSEVAQLKHDGARGSEPLSLIAKLSRELVDSMSEIVWAINPQKDHLSDLSQKMRHFASDLLTSRGIEFRFRAPDVEHDINVGANVRRELFLIFKEAVNNTVRHSCCSEVDIEFQADDRHLVLTLSDNGKGFDVGEKSSGHGLSSMRERALLLGGKLEIKSAAGQGAMLRFVIPLNPSGQNFQ